MAYTLPKLEDSKKPTVEEAHDSVTTMDKIGVGKIFNIPAGHVTGDSAAVTLLLVLGALRLTGNTVPPATALVNLTEKELNSMFNFDKNAEVPEQLATFRA